MTETSNTKGKRGCTQLLNNPQRLWNLACLGKWEEHSYFKLSQFIQLSDIGVKFPTSFKQSSFVEQRKNHLLSVSVLHKSVI